jgi:hypothetical protein
LHITKEGVTTVEVNIVRIVIAQKQVNVQTVKDNIKFLRRTVLYSRNSKTKDKSTESYNHPVQIVKIRILFINCQLFKTAYGLADTIEKYDIDVLCLNETFEKDKNRVLYKDWKIYSSPRPNQTRGGAKISVKPSINYVSQQIFNEQMQTIEMTCIKKFQRSTNS